MKGANNSYWGNITEAFKTLFTGLKLTVNHLWQARKGRKPLAIQDEKYFEQSTGIFTVQYPKEVLPVPANGRYKLHNEIDDCIVCDKCAKICPVDCIEIEPIKAVAEFGKTSDGTPKRIYAAKFDIDMAKCCFCGLCTTVCPTECLTMTDTYDFSVFDIREHNFPFSNMTVSDIEEKKNELEEFNKEKQKAALAKLKGTEVNENQESEAEPVTQKTKPTFKPRVINKPKSASENPDENSVKTDSIKKESATDEGSNAKRLSEENKEQVDEAKAKALALMKAKIKEKAQGNDSGEDQKESTGTEAQVSDGVSKPKPVFRPKVKPVVKKEKSDSTEAQQASSANETPEKGRSANAKPRPVFKPKIKSESASEELQTEEGESENGIQGKKNEEKELHQKPKPVVKPIIKSKQENVQIEKEAEGDEKEEGVKSVQVNKPVIKPKVRPVIRKKDEGENN